MSKEQFACNTGRILIEHNGYEITDTSSLAASIIKYSFYKNNKNNLTAISFIDADRLDYGRYGLIEDMIHKEMNAFKKATVSNSIIYFKVFVTEFGIDENTICSIMHLYSLMPDSSSLIPVLIDLNNDCIIMPDKNNRDCIDFYYILKQSIEDKYGRSELYDLKEIYEKHKKRLGYVRQKPYATYTIIAANIIVFGITSLFGGISNFYVLVAFGAKVNSLIAQGQYWRLIASSFLHAGLAHIAFNMYGLYNLGSIVEDIYGTKKFLSIYALAALSGSIASFTFSSSPSVGASGAIFGLFGAILYLGQKNPKMFRTSFGINILLVLGFNILYGFSSSGIDNFAHLGGLIGGYICSNITGTKYDNKMDSKKIILSIAAAAVLLVVFWAGIYAASYSR